VKRKKEKRIEVTEGEGEEDEVDDSTLQILRSYFQLGGLSASDRSTNVNPTEEDILSRLYKEWAKADDRMRIIVEALPGMRILRQPPVECLFSFICSSNNNISRITQMLEKLRQRYGTKINVNDAPSSTISSPTSSSLSESSQTISTFYSFPTVEALSAASEEELRGLGLGYRAKFVRATAIALSSKGGEDFLISLRSKPRKEVQAALLEFVGVGMKVAVGFTLLIVTVPLVVSDPPKPSVTVTETVYTPSSGKVTLGLALVDVRGFGFRTGDANGENVQA
jgi:N-glycosylase/DNA lyase